MKRTMIVCMLWLLTAGMAYGAGGDTAAVEKAENPSGEVRNLIYLIGDGMGLAQVSMLEIAGNYAPTAFGRAQSVALVATRSANNRVTDSAAAGTALATGQKTCNAMLGQDPAGNPLHSMISRAAERGMATGIAVTCYLQHATPAAFYAHVPDRSDLRAVTRDLAAVDVDVLIGGGGKWLAETDGGARSFLDGFGERGYRVVRSLADADTLVAGRLLCVAAEEHLPPAAERGEYLPQAVRKALQILSNDAAERDEGFLLMVEGSQIDMACHAKDAEWMLDEMRDFEQAVAAAMDFADRTPGTLVVIVADHETGGLALPANDADFTRGENGLQGKFGAGGHTAIRVPAYFYGTGAERFGGLMENTELARQLMEALELRP